MFDTKLIFTLFPSPTNDNDLSKVNVFFIV